MANINKDRIIINGGNPHPSNIDMVNKNVRLPSRKSNDFPVGENVRCSLGGASFGALPSGLRYIDIKHKVRVPDIRLGKEGKLINRYFSDRYFFSAAKDCNVVTSSSDERLIWRFISFIGGKIEQKDGDNLQDFIESCVLEVGKKLDKVYFLKTRLRLNEANNTLYLERGNFPYYSEKNDLKYGRDEEYQHSYIVYGGERLKELQK